MSSVWGHFAGIVTVFLMVIFIGIWLWAWRPRHKNVFDSLSRIPMADTDAADETQERIE